MNNIKQILTRLYGRDPTDQELKRVYGVATAMGISDNDEFILLIACLEAYHSLFGEIPAKTTSRIQKAAETAEKQATTLINQWMITQKKEFNHILERTEEFVESMRSASNYAEKQATATIKKISAEQQETLTQAVAASAEKVAAAASAKTLAKWIGSGVVICCLCLIGTGIAGFKLGKDSGIAQGIAQTTDHNLLIKKRDAWTNTQSFKLAHALYEAGKLDKILECKYADNWIINNGFCYPNASGEKVNGWKMPQLDE